MGGAMMYLKRDTPQGEVILELSGPLTGPWAAQEFQEALDDALEKNPTGLILNLLGVEAINSSCLGKIFLTHKHLKEKAIDLSIRGCTPDVLNTLQLVRADAILDISLEPS